jgi:apolipoprotein D and lipocalin family protein
MPPIRNYALPSISLVATALVTVFLAATTHPSARAEDTSPPAHRPQPVSEVDLDRYVGLWYEIARVPNKFQKSCLSSTTAEYVLRDDGKIDVVNRCLEADGKVNEAKGVARVVDEESNARLKVSFVRFLGRSWFWGDYWILELGEDYEYAVVGHPERKYGWILSRTPELEEATLKGIFEKLEGHGYERESFQMSSQESRDEPEAE